TLRRTRSISTGSNGNDSSTDNNFLPNQRIFDNNNNTKQYTPQPNSLLDSHTSQNLQPLVINEMSFTTTSPPTPSKNKTADPFSFRKQRKPFNGSTINPPTSKLDFKNIFFFLIFLCAVVFFLCSLCGIGPVDEELLIETDTSIIINDPNPIVGDYQGRNKNNDVNNDEIVENDNNITTDEKPTDQPNNNENIIPTPNDIIEDTMKENDLEFSDKPKIKLTHKKITNKLGKKKRTKYNSLSDEQNKEFAKLRRLQKHTDDSLDYSCGSWQEGYTKLHNEIINGSAAQRYAGYVCDAKMNCGGLADRILGMTSTFLFALLTDRAFLADWQVPLPLDAIFESPNIDWSYDSFDPSYVIKDLDTTEINIIDYDLQDLDYYFPLTNWTTRYPDPFIKFYTNQGLIQRTFDSKYYSSKLKEIGLKPHTAFGCIVDYLFRPVPPALSFITQYSALFALPNIFSVGIHIRTGDVYEQTLSLQDYSHFFSCADQITRTYAPPNKKVIYYLVTDSIKLREEAYSKFNHVIISGFSIDPGHDYYDHADGVNNAIVENWILSKTDYRVSFHSKQLHSTVSLSTTESNYIDCTRKDAFTTFSEMTNEWSIS
ncbi:9696_t:CDS:2, partial [Entrophospora sp. SA101]